jgi:hypothetical protein
VRVLGLSLQAEFKILDSVFVAAEDLGVFGKLGESVEGSQHLVGCPLKEATAATKEDGVASENAPIDILDVLILAFVFLDHLEIQVR